MFKFTYKSKYSTYENCYILEGRYSHGGGIGLQIWSDTEGCICSITTNTDERFSDDYIAVKNYSENEGLDKFLIDLGFIAPSPVRHVTMGYTMIPIYRITDLGKSMIVRL